MDDVADTSLQGSEGFFGGLALGDLAVVVAATRAVPEPDLGDGGHVDGVVEGVVPAAGKPPDLAGSGRHLDGSRCR